MVRRWTHGKHALENCERGSRGKSRGPLSQVHFVPRIALGHDLAPFVTTISHVYFCWMSEHSCRIQSGQCTLNLHMAFRLAFVLSHIEYTVCARQWYLNWSVLRRFWERTALIIFSMCWLMFISTFSWSGSSEVKQPSSEHCFLWYICV